MKKYLIAVDLDGTILPDLKSLSDYSIKIFRKLTELGHKIVITTGRPFRSSSFVYEAFDLKTPIINYNGALIHNPKDKNFKIYCDEMSKKDILKIYNERKEDYSVFFCEKFDHIYSNIDEKNAYPLMHKDFGSTMSIGDLNIILDEKFHSALILAKPNHGKGVMDYINNEFDNIGARMWSYGDYDEIIELYSKKSNKGLAIKRVMMELGFKKEETIACGDGQNDIEFFKEAGYSVALSNADQAIKDMATCVYHLSSKESGLAHFFNEYFDLGIDE